jgi:hypothetical protein
MMALTGHGINANREARTCDVQPAAEAAGKKRALSGRKSALPTGIGRFELHTHGGQAAS